MISIRRAAVCCLVMLALMATWAGHANANDRVKIIAFGDSLVAGYGLKPGQSFPDQLQAALTAKGVDVEIVNSGVSGDTTSGGLARFDWAIPADAGGVILELGANDALRGLPPERARANLKAILAKLKAAGLPVLIAGMRSPANWGPDYQAAFDKIYADLAKEFDVALYPFFLEGVVQNEKLNQRDGIHPNADGVAVIVERMMPSVLKLIAQVRARAEKS